MNTIHCFVFSANKLSLYFFSYSHICLLKALYHEYIAVLGQFWVEVITYSLFPFTKCSVRDMRKISIKFYQEAPTIILY